MSWLTATIKRNLPKKNPIKHLGDNLTGGANNMTNIFMSGFGTSGLLGESGLGGLVNNFTGVTNPLLSKGLNNLLDINEEGSLFGRARKFGGDMGGFAKDNFLSKELSKGWATGSDRLIPDKYQDVFKGMPNMGIPNIPMPGHGAVKYLNERTKQLGYLENKLYGLRDYGGDLGDKTMQLFGQGKDKGGGGGSSSSTKPSSNRVKGPGTLIGKSAKFVMNKKGKNTGRSSLRITKGGRSGSSSGVSDYKWKTNM